MKKTIKTTAYYGARRMNYRTPAGLGYTMLRIFDKSGDFTTYIRNDKTGYCRNDDTGKRISNAKWDELYATCYYAF